MALLGESSYDDGSDENEKQDLSTYHSVLHGPRPVMAVTKSKSEQLDQLIAQITGWVEAGIDENEIAVASRIKAPLDAVAAELRSAGIGSIVLDNAKPKGEGVRLGTMHRMKGLEFRAVAVVDVNDDLMPFHYELTDKSADEVQHRIDLMRERATLYVACTRARDQLWVGTSGKPSRFIEPML